VSQSNSKNARRKRLEFLIQLFLNETELPNSEQKEIMGFYEIDDYKLYRLNSNYYSLPYESILEIKYS
jgi:hypothetical protein